jgi:hypothetical protein
LDSVSVHVDDLVKDGAISAVTRVFDALWRRRLRRSPKAILDKIINMNKPASKRSRPPSDEVQVLIADTAWWRRHSSDIVGAITSPGKTT